VDMSIENFITSFCPPGGCMACMGCSSRTQDKTVTTEQRQTDTAIKSTEYKPANAPQDIAALLYQTWEAAYWTGGKLHKPTVVTYSFATEFSNFGAATVSGAAVSTTGKWGILDENFKEKVRMAAAVHSAATGIELIEVTDNTSAQIVWRLEEFHQVTGLGTIMAPGPNAWNGDIWINMRYVDTFNALNMSPGSEGFVWLLHEFGHAIGMKHLQDNNYKPSAGVLDNRNTTIMSHTLAPDGQVRTDLSAKDISALSYVYGSAKAKENLPVQWSQLSGGGLQSTGGSEADTIMGVADRDLQRGGAGNDLLMGASGNDTLDGGAGSDTLIGGTGTDALVVRARRGDGTYTLIDVADPKEVGASRGYLVINNERDVYEGIEEFRFRDGTLNIATGSWKINESFKLAERLVWTLLGTQDDDLATTLADRIDLEGSSVSQTVADFLVEHPTSIHTAISNIYGETADALMSSIGSPSAMDPASASLIIQLSHTAIAHAAVAQVYTPPAQINAPIMSSYFSQRFMPNESKAASYRGTADRDAFFESAGNSTIYGGEGEDRIYVSRFRNDTDWSFQTNGQGGSVLTLGTKTIYLNSVEQIHFLDNIYDISESSLAAKINRITLGLTGNVASESKLGATIAAIESGQTTLKDYADGLVLTADFSGRVGIPIAGNGASLVSSIFFNIAGRSPSAQETTAWIEVFKNYGHALTGYFASTISEGAEAKAMWRPALSNGQWITDSLTSGLAEILSLVKGGIPTRYEVAKLNFFADRDSMSLRDVADHVIDEAGISSLGASSFTKMVFDNLGPGAQTTESGILAQLLADAVITKSEFLAGLVIDPIVFQALDEKIQNGWKSQPLGAGDGLSEPVVSLIVDSMPIIMRANVYDGPVSYINYSVSGSSGNDVVNGTALNDFIFTGAADDAVDAGDGDDVIDGGTGSNFLTGGRGFDVFFVDGRQPGRSWSTITDWEEGEQVSIWGWRPGVSNLGWAASAGAEGWKGATAHIDFDGNGVFDASLTWSGLTIEKLPKPTEHDGLLWFA